VTDQVYALLVLAANALMLLLLTSEASAYWRVHDAMTARGFEVREDQFAREMTLSITWALYATALIVAGIRKRYAPIRYLAMVIFAVTIGKVFAFDLPQLGEIYRVLSIIGLGVMLLVSSYLYHRSEAGCRRNRRLARGIPDGRTEVLHYEYLGSGTLEPRTSNLELEPRTMNENREPRTKN
jgi:uncharacterized membrane protein